MNQVCMLVAAAVAGSLAVGTAASAHPEHDSKQEVREIKIVKADGAKTVTVEADDKAFAADCGKGRKFESSSSTGEDNNRNVSKMVICSDPGESDEAWVKTLREALSRVEGNADMPSESKAKIIADLQSEIARTGK